MCGLAGVCSRDGGPVDGAVLERLIGALAHRGPDGAGVHCDGGIGFGHRRLSILDPSEAGSQPMHRGATVLVHNGEIYNYLELAAELRDLGEVITTGTDTEVILAAYARWGPAAIARFNGMFAIALWDAAHSRLLLARDRMGVKPMYLRRSRRTLAFASEPRAFVAAGPLDVDDAWLPEPRLGVVHDFLSRGWTDHSNETFIQGVTSLPPAHLLIVEAGRERLVRYWDAPPLADDARPVARAGDLERDQSLVDEFRATFDSSVRLQLRSDVPLGSCLSGGLDSSSIVMTVSHLLATERGGAHEEAPRMGFHARFPAEGVDESAYAELVARQAGIPLVFATPAGSPLLPAMLPVLRAQGEPFPSGSMGAQHAVMAAARTEGIKVLLDGQGADELIGGYDLYLGARAAGLLRSRHPTDAARELRAQVARGPSSAQGALWTALHAALPRPAVEALRATTGGRFGIRCTGPLVGQTAMPEVESGPGTFLARRLWHATAVDGLPALLRYEDRNSMAFGIEARVPFLDVRLVELAMRLPDRLKVEHGVTKAVLRRAMNERLPSQVARRRDKVGFEVPQRAWLAAGRKEVIDLLGDGQVVERGWVTRQEVDRVIEAGFGGGRGSNHLWRLFILEAWLRVVWPSGSRIGGRTRWEDGLARAETGPAVRS
jgi:asparagine synthase (glutamine-hydrolysing)